MSSLLRATLAAALVFAAPAAGLFIASDAQASVSIAVAFDVLVKESTAVAMATPFEQSSVWENGRIYTYSHIHADNAVAGELPTGGEAWVRTMGGVVNHIGQIVDGEPVLTVGRPSLLFLTPGPPGSYEVTARAQGQFAVTLDDKKLPLLMRSSAVGVLLPPPPPKAAAPAPATPGATQQQSISPAVNVVLAGDVLHSRKLDDGVRDIAAAWKRLHADK